MEICSLFLDKYFYDVIKIQFILIASRFNFCHFLKQVIHQKYRISYDEIINDLCPVSIYPSRALCVYETCISLIS